MKPSRAIASRRFVLDVTMAVVAILVLIVIMSWVLRQDVLNRYSHATMSEVFYEIGRAVCGSGDWAPGPPQSSLYVLLYSTVYLTLKGFLIGLLLAIPTGIAVGMKPEWTDRAVTALNALRAIPLTLLTVVLAVLPAWTRWLLIAPGLTFEAPNKDPATLIALGCFLYISVGIADGIGQRSTEREKLFRRTLGLSRRKYLWVVLAHEARPSIMTACRVALLFSLVLAIVFEQLLNYPGAGKQVSKWMNDAGTVRPPGPYPEAQALALIVLIATTGILLDFAFVAVKRRALRWQRST